MSNTPKIWEYPTLSKLVTRLRDDLNNANYVLLFAYNGTGKTRLSMEFKNAGKETAPATHSISTPTPKTSFPGTMILKAIRSVIYASTQSPSFFPASKSWHWKARYFHTLNAMRTLTSRLTTNSGQFRSRVGKKKTSRFLAAKRIFSSGVFSLPFAPLSLKDTSPMHG